MTKEKSKKISNSQFVILEEMKNINISYKSLKLLEPEKDTISIFQKFKEILSEKNSYWTFYIRVINYLRSVKNMIKLFSDNFSMVIKYIQNYLGLLILWVLQYQKMLYYS